MPARKANTPQIQTKGWLGRLNPRLHLFMALVAGLVAALGQSPVDLWPLALLGFAALFALFTQKKTARVAGWLGWAGGTGYFAVTLVWIVEPFMVDAARHGWMAPFALALMAAGGGLFWGAGFALARAVGARPVAWILALTLVELARGYILTGFPWGLIGYTLAPSPLAQMAGFVGSYGLTLLVLMMAVTLWRLSQPRPLVYAGPMLAVYAALFVAGQQVAQDLPAHPATPAHVRLIQPNAPQDQKWDRAMMPVFYNRLLDATSAPPAHGQPAPDLIIWPETSLPTLLEWADDALAKVAERADGVPVVVGIQRREGLRLFNSALLLGASGKIEAIYDKYHLVPFGEYLPFGDRLARFGLSSFAAQEGHGYSAGVGPQLWDLPGIGLALPLICYEAVFPQDVAAAPARPVVLLQITNDAWFGRFSGPQQHLMQARMRAIEQGLPLVRAANTGVSAVIDARGHVVASLGLGQTGFVDAMLPAALPATPYSRTGDWLVLILLVGGLFRAGMSHRRAERHK